MATVKRALDRMVEVGLLTRTVIGNQHHYQANPACPIHDELAAIVRKTLGASGAIREALSPLALPGTLGPMEPMLTIPKPDARVTSTPE